jgi:hypothetical protein
VKYLGIIFVIIVVIALVAAIIEGVLQAEKHGG